MISIKFLFFFIPLLSIILIFVNLLLAPHVPYKEKKTPFECGYHSFLLQNRTQFTISFFVFAILFLLFDLEIVLIYPLSVSIEHNGIYGLVSAIIFIGILTVGFVFELGKGALKIESRQNAPGPHSNMQLLQSKSINNPFNTLMDARLENASNITAYVERDLKQVNTVNNFINESKIDTVSNNNLSDVNTHQYIPINYTENAIIQKIPNWEEHHIKLLNKWAANLKNTNDLDLDVVNDTNNFFTDKLVVLHQPEYHNIFLTYYINHIHIIFPIIVCICYYFSAPDFLEIIEEARKARKAFVEFLRKQYKEYVEMMLKSLWFMLSHTLSDIHMLGSLIASLIKNMPYKIYIKYWSLISEVLNKYNNIKNEKEYNTEDNSSTKPALTPPTVQDSHMNYHTNVPGMLFIPNGNTDVRDPRTIIMCILNFYRAQLPVNDIRNTQLTTHTLPNISRYIERVSTYALTILSEYQGLVSNTYEQARLVNQYRIRSSQSTHPMISFNAYRIMVNNHWGLEQLNIVLEEIRILCNQRHLVPWSYMEEILRLFIGWLLHNIEGTVVRYVNYEMEDRYSTRNYLSNGILYGQMQRLRANSTQRAINHRNATVDRFRGFYMVLDTIYALTQIINTMTNTTQPYASAPEEWQAIGTDFAQLHFPLSIEFNSMLRELVIRLRALGFTDEYINSILQALRR